MQGLDSYRDSPVCVARGGHRPVGPAANEALVRELVGRDDGECVADVARRATGAAPATGASAVRPHAAVSGHQTRAVFRNAPLAREFRQGIGKRGPARRSDGTSAFSATLENLSQEAPVLPRLASNFSLHHILLSLTGSSPAARPNRPEHQPPFFCFFTKSSSYVLSRPPSLPLRIRLV